MGNNNSDMSEAEFRQKWKPVDSAGSVSLWQNKENPDQKVEQYEVRQNQAEFSQKLYQLRRNNPFLVNAYTLRKEGYSCQIDHDTRKIFVERIPLRLSNVENIPYPDILHVYDSSLNGYSQLCSTVGSFSIDEDQIGINEKGKVKVWLNNLFQSSRVGGTKVTEPVMVRELLRILQANTDQDSRGRYPDLGWYIGNHDNITFREAQQKFIQYVKEYNNGEIPLYLNCVFEHGGSGIIENWCRNHDSYGYSGESIREREELFRNKTNANVGGTLRQNSQIGSNNPAQSQFSTGTAPAAQSLSQVQTAHVIPPQVTQQTVPVGPSQPVQARSPQQSPILVTTGSGVRNPPSGTRFTNQRRVEVTGPQVVNFPRSEERIISEPIIGISPLQQQPPPNHSFKITTGQPVATGQSLPRFVQKAERVQPPQPEGRVPLPPIPERYSVASTGNTQKQESSQVRPNFRGVSQGQQPEPVLLSHPPQIVESVTYDRNQERVSTDNLQDKPTISNKTDAYQPLTLNETKLQQQRVISQTYEIKDEGRPQSTVQPSGATYQTDYKSTTQDYSSKINTQNYSSKVNTQDYSSKVNTQDYYSRIGGQDYASKGTTAEAGLTDYGRAVPYSFNIEEDRKAETKIDSSKFVASEDGKSSPQFLAFLKEIKSGADSNPNLSSGYNATSTVSQNQQGGQGTNSYQASSYEYKPQQFKFSSGDYNLGSYQANIDPDLTADLAKYKQ